LEVDKLIKDSFFKSEKFKRSRPFILIGPIKKVTIKINNMAAEVKTLKAGGVKIETIVSKATHRKLKKLAKRSESSIAQIIRDQVQGLVK
jgi:hypothetical protein